MFTFKEKLDLEKGLLSVVVTMPKLERDEVQKKVRTCDVLYEMEKKYKITGFFKNNTLLSSYEEEVKAEWVFKVEVEKNKKPFTKKNKNEPITDAAGDISS